MSSSRAEVEISSGRVRDDSGEGRGARALIEALSTVLNVCSNSIQGMQHHFRGLSREKMPFRYASQGVSLGNSVKHGYQQEETRAAAEVTRKLGETRVPVLSELDSGEPSIVLLGGCNRSS